MFDRSTVPQKSQRKLQEEKLNFSQCISLRFVTWRQIRSSVHTGEIWINTAILVTNPEATATNSALCKKSCLAELFVSQRHPNNRLSLKRGIPLDSHRGDERRPHHLSVTRLSFGKKNYIRKGDDKKWRSFNSYFNGVDSVFIKKKYNKLS